MNRSERDNRGYALIVALIITMVAAALVLGFITEVNTTQKISNNDKDYSGAFYGAEAGLEKMNSDLAKLFLKKVFPSTADLAGIQDTAHFPSLPSMTFSNYELTGGQSARLTAALASTDTTATVDSTTGWPSRGFLMIDAEEITYTGTTSTTFTGLTRGQNSSTAAAHINNSRVFRSAVVTLSEGANAGLNAQTIPFTLDVTARTSAGTEARLRREVQVALIPVFQFGVFSESDLSFFAGPNFDFGGRVHSNNNIFLAEGGGTLTLSQKITSAGEIIRSFLANGVSVDPSYLGTVRVASSPGVYRNLGTDEGSLVGGPTSAANAAWPGLSLTTYNKNILSKGTGAKALTLPFVADGYSPIELIRRPPADEDVDTTMGQSRLANQASLRVFISDVEANLPGGSGHILDNTMAGYTTIDDGVSFRPPFAQSNPADPDFVQADGTDETATNPLIKGYILIQRHNNDGSWTDVTTEILNLGISTNQANAILRFQKPKWDLLDTTNSLTATDYVVLNMYDAREARFRDTNSSVGTNLRKLGIMNVIELDVSKLKNWFNGTIGATGNQAVSNNGYILYFSDRRGNRDNDGNETAELGFEDFVNPGDVNGDPNDSLETGEDLNGNGTLEKYGANLPYAPYTASTDIYSTSLPPQIAEKAINLTLPIADTATTSFNVSSVAGLSAGYYRIDNEIVNCTSVAATPMTCSRGQLGTVAATHIPSSAINLVANVADAVTTSFSVKSDANVTVPGYYRVDSETILCTAKAANVLTCQRGMFGTTAATHSVTTNPLGANVLVGDTSITLLNSTGLGTGAAWYRIDDETIQCTRAGTTLTCVRGQLGTAAVAHSAASLVGLSASTNAAVNNVTTTFPFAVGVLTNVVVPNYYRIDNETVNCTAKTATTMTCTRARLGTAAAAHVLGSTMRLALSAAVNNSTTSIPFSTVPASVTVPNYYRIDNEVLNCSAKSATDLTCARAQLNTSAAAHNSGPHLQTILTISLVNVQPVNLFTSERASKNRVTYFRRALRLVNGQSPNLPTPGFTVTSENPVYVQGNYNSNGDTNFADAHSAAAVIGDAVTLLSNNWATGGDERSFIFPYTVGSRSGTTTFYRMAIASGKGINFDKPGEETIQDFGTDGGTHNFLRYLESWGGTSYYRGSIVSLYYYRQAVGPYKCCSTVYSPPTRNYAFDTEFLVPSQLPPGTPRFRDVNNLSFRQTIRADDTD